MRANPTLHVEAFKKLATVVGVGASVVDVGAGQGAFSQRLQDSGFHVVSVDVNVLDFKAKDIDYVQVDFNSEKDISDFKDRYAGKFDASIGMEVIEHVENPWEYIRFLSQLVKPGGIIFITTPNIESAMSKIQFLFTNEHAHFSCGDYNDSGHINPLTLLEFKIICKNAGLTMMESGGLCMVPKFILSRNIPVCLYSVVNVFFGWAFGASANKDILYVILKKE